MSARRLKRWQVMEVARPQGCKAEVPKFRLYAPAEVRSDGKGQRFFVRTLGPSLSVNMTGMLKVNMIDRSVSS